MSNWWNGAVALCAPCCRLWFVVGHRFAGDYGDLLVDRLKVGRRRLCKCVIRLFDLNICLVPRIGESLDRRYRNGLCRIIVECLIWE